MVKYIICGDVHGDLNLLMYPILHWLKRGGGEDTKLVFLGDYVDRGHSNVYIYEILKVLIKQNNVILLRGNHESYEYGTYDNYSGYGFIGSFMYSKFHELPLKTFHYENGILFSHSPLSRPLKSMSLSSMDLTFTSDVINDRMTYKNIHGHDHKCSSILELNDFMTGDLKMISLDTDSSYGFRTHSTMNSLVYFIEFDFKNKTFEIFNDNIVVGSDRDFNSKSFDVIKKTLGFNDLSYDESYQHFITSMWGDAAEDGLLKRIKDIYKYNTRNRKRNSIYFDDVPLEFYHQLNLLKDVNDGSPYEVYQKILKSSHRALIGGGDGRGNVNRVMYMILLIIVIVIITVVSIYSVIYRMTTTSTKSDVNI